MRQYEEKYSVKIDLIDKTGLIQVDSDTSRIEREYLDHSYLQNVTSDEFYFEEGAESSRMTKYMEDLDWYLVDKDFTWTYAHPHEAGLGPYFYQPEAQSKPPVEPVV